MKTAPQPIRNHAHLHPESRAEFLIRRRRINARYATVWVIAGLLVVARCIIASLA